MTDRELMQQALEALELLAKYENPATKVQVRKPRNGGPIVTMYPHKVATEAAAPLRERLAQPEPQAPRPDYRDWDYQDQLDEQEKSAQSPLDRMAENARELGLDYEPVDTKVNSEAIPEQISEPVGEIVQAFADLTAVSIPIMPPVGTKLYTTPPRREWVGLDRKEMLSIIDQQQAYKETGLPMFYRDQCLDMLRAIEAKLKEKNS